jgi:hypothetical protein
VNLRVLGRNTCVQAISLRIIPTAPGQKAVRKFLMTSTAVDGNGQLLDGKSRVVVVFARGRLTTAQ